MNITEMIQMIGENAWIYGGSFILILSVLVFVHEWGHYIVARLCGVHVEEFSIGFGPEIFGFNDRHGTRWKFSWIPLGGFVKMYGDSDPASAGHEGAEAIPKDRLHEAFFTQPVAKRAAIVFAGPAINYIFAILVMGFIFFANGQPLTSSIVSGVVLESAADKAGFEPHDQVIAIDGAPARSFEDIRRAVAVSLEQERSFTVLRGGEELTLKATPEKRTDTDRFGFESSRGFLGLTSAYQAMPFDKIASIDGQEIAEGDDVQAMIAARFGTSFDVGLEQGEDTVEGYRVRPIAEMNADMAEQGYFVLRNADPEVTIKYNVLEAFSHSVGEAWSMSADTLKALGQMFVGQRSPTELGGLIRIGSLAGDMAQSGIVAMLMFSALLSINLGLINLFPIPVLDGGHLVFYALEAVRGKPLSEKVQDYAFRVGFGVLIALMAFANINDLIQILSGA